MVVAYADRLATGRSIGSGQIEGACKNMVGRRLKQTGDTMESQASQTYGRTLCQYVQPTMKSLLESTRYIKTEILDCTLINETNAFDRVGGDALTEHSCGHNVHSLQRARFRIKDDKLSLEARRRFTRIKSQCFPLREKKTDGNERRFPSLQQARQPT